MHFLEKSLRQQVKGCESGATLIIRNRRDEDLPSSKSGTLRMQRVAHIPKTFGKKQEKGRKLALTSYLQSPSALKHALYVVGQHFFSASGVALAMCLIWENGENCHPSPFLYLHSLAVECVHNCAEKGGVTDEEGQTNGRQSDLLRVTGVEYKAGLQAWLCCTHFLPCFPWSSGVSVSPQHSPRHPEWEVPLFSLLFSSFLILHFGDIFSNY